MLIYIGSGVEVRVNQINNCSDYTVNMHNTEQCGNNARLFVVFTFYGPFSVYLFSTYINIGLQLKIFFIFD